MKRKYPVSFFFFGVLGNLLRYIIIGLIGLALLIIGFFGVDACIIAGAIVLACYLLLCIIRQISIRSTCLKESGNPDFDELIDGAFGENSHEGSASSPHERIVQMVEEKIKSQETE